MNEKTALVNADKMNMELLIKKMIEGQQVALSRLISIVENEPAKMSEILPYIQQYLGKSFCIGLTGPPGAGKSSLVNQITKLLRDDGKKVGIIAVDPTSPFTGGALLGDRIRMQDLYLDPGVFIRSMATRGSLGGLASATRDAIKLIDSFGMDYILVETVGVGQTELDIIQTTDITVVVVVPEGGDSIQAMKAGLMEIGDIFVINKSDRPGAKSMEMQLQTVLQMNPRFAVKMPPIIMTQGNKGRGVEELVAAIRLQETEQRREGLDLRRKQRAKTEFEDILKYTIVQEWQQLLDTNDFVRQKYREMIDGKLDPYTILKQIFPQGMINKLI